MPPDFSKPTIETLAKRAGFLCSNVECRVLTAGPAAIQEKSVVIGEAAHIFGAQPGSARFRQEMTDVARGEITNAIWLCRNCHKAVDSDPVGFPADLLFAWRQSHDDYIGSRLGTPGDRIQADLTNRRIAPFRDDSPLAVQIIVNRAAGWEWRLAAELLKDYLTPTFRGWADLQKGLYVRLSTFPSGSDPLKWCVGKFQEAQRLIAALNSLYSQELPNSWGLPGTPGDPLEIKHVCGLIANAAHQILQWEESLYFAVTDDKYSDLINSIRGVVGTQLETLKSVPPLLDEVADWAVTNPGVPKEFHHVLKFDVPEGWTDRIAKTLKQLQFQ